VITTANMPQLEMQSQLQQLNMAPGLVSNFSSSVKSEVLKL